jgi:hypothetical protein
VPRLVPLLLLVVVGLLTGGCGGGGNDTAVAPPPVPRALPKPSEGFFVAKPAQITHDVVERGPRRRFHGVEWTRMDTVMVGTLGAILGAGDYESLEAQMKKSERDCASGDCSLFRVPVAVRDQLAVLTHPDLFARRWASTQAMQLDHVSLSDLRPVVVGLRRLAREAKADGSQLWVWRSL